MRMNRELSREVVARKPVLIEPLTSRLARTGNELCAIGVVVRGLIEWADGRRDAYDDRLRKMLEIAQKLSSAHQRDRVHGASPWTLRNGIRRARKSAR